MPSNLTRLYLLIALAMVAFGDSAFPKGISFPGRDSCLSPGKLWKVTCQEDKVHEGVFKLILRNLKKGTEEHIFEGGRYCEVLWKKDESCLAITDWAGSNFSDILLHGSNQTGPGGSVRNIISMATIQASVSEEELVGLCYWEALSWEPDGRLRFRVFGHTDTTKSREFSHTFLVKLPARTLTLLKSTRPNPQGGANGSQPLRSETNRTSPAAGSRR